MEKIKNCLEIQFFGVCSYMGEKLGISSSKIRLFFIYTSFIAFGSPLLIYLALAFLIDLKDYFRGKRTRILDM